MENVLLYMANECCKITKCSCKEYSIRYFNAIRLFPGNVGKTNKTLHNWRTETPALFGFYNENKSLDVTETSKMAFFLNEHQDLTQFLRLFLLTFQFPGGHLKPNDIADIISKDIRFKPAQLIMKVLFAGNDILAAEGSEKEMSISAEEATYCIFNDSRVTSGMTPPKQIAATILDNRRNRRKYYNKKDPNIFSSTGNPRSKGDVQRYAGDILDYMETANLLTKRHNHYYLLGNEHKAVSTFIADDIFFDGYDHLYGKHDISSVELSAIEPKWFQYVNDRLDPDLFRTDITTLFSKSTEIAISFYDKISDVISSDDTTSKDIGNLGEALICGHEKMRLRLNGYAKFAKLVQIIDSPSYHPGYDIDSFEGDGTDHHRYIEVKTTISKKRVQLRGFHMSTNEWSVAETIKEHYYVYRLMLSNDDIILYVLRDSVRLYKTDKILASPRDGMEVSFDTETINADELLIWKN